MFPKNKPRAVITGNCLLHEPEARSVAMDVSVGYGDDYRAYLEGQSIDVTGLRAGHYQLVHGSTATDDSARPATPTTLLRCSSG